MYVGKILEFLKPIIKILVESFNFFLVGIFDISIWFWCGNQKFGYFRKNWDVSVYFDFWRFTNKSWDIDLDEK